MPDSDAFLLKLPKLPTPAQMRQWDAEAASFGIPGSMLMENAGRAVFALLDQLAPQISGSTVWIFMGPGNNGGDAACLARHLKDAGATPVVFHTAPLENLKGAAAWHARLAAADNVVFQQLAPETDSILEQAHSPAPPAAIVDGVLGTGFAGQLKPAIARLITAVNSAARLLRCPVLAIDVPSGLNALTGLPSPVAIQATATVTLEAPKPGLILPAARKWTGSVYTRKIGFPQAIAGNLPASWRLLDGRALLEAERFAPASYKNTYGHVYVAGGATGLEGAAHLASAAALRAGAGLVTAVAPARSLPLIQNGWPEIMTQAASPDAAWPVQPDFAWLARATSLVVGPGMGRGEDAAAFLEALLHMEDRPPAVFDADSLILMAQNRSWLAKVKQSDILTPHPGEAAALLECEGRDIQADRPEALKRLTALSPAAVALKGSATLAGQGDAPRLICPYDIPQLAIAGAGDVLSGCAGAMLARYDAMTALARAIVAHAMAGLILAREYPERGAVASDLANALARVGIFIRSEHLANTAPGLAPWPACA